MYSEYDMTLWHLTSSLAQVLYFLLYNHISTFVYIRKAGSNTYLQRMWFWLCIICIIV